MSMEIVQGEIAAAPVDGRVMVFTALSGQQPLGPCPYTPRGDDVDPAPGNSCCIAVSDDESLSWVLSYEP